MSKSTYLQKRELINNLQLILLVSYNKKMALVSMHVAIEKLDKDKFKRKIRKLGFHSQSDALRLLIKAFINDEIDIKVSQDKKRKKR